MPRGNTKAERTKGLRRPPKGSRNGGGRQKGTPNKVTREIKEAIFAAAENCEHSAKYGGGLVGYMTYLATKLPTTYAALVGRLIPLQAKIESDNVQHTIRAKPVETMTPQELSEYYQRLMAIPRDAKVKFIEHDPN